jgi:hypothetical protein
VATEVRVRFCRRATGGATAEGAFGKRVLLEEVLEKAVSQAGTGGTGAASGGAVAVRVSTAKVLELFSFCVRLASELFNTFGKLVGALLDGSLA